MSLQTAHRLVTAQEFQSLPDNCLDHELMRGEIHEMPKPGGRHANLAIELGFWLIRYVKENNSGKVLDECGFLFERNPDTVRAPDLAVLKPEDVDWASNAKFIEVPPAIAVEINSPNDLAGDVLDKARWWLSHGVQQVWVVDDPTRTLTIYYPDGSEKVYGENQVLDAGQALPGFTLALQDLFAA